MKREFFGTSEEDALRRASLLFGVEAQFRVLLVEPKKKQ